MLFLPFSFRFDVAGAGACLKKYSDPSFFKMEFASSGMMEEEVQWEMKARKTRVRNSALNWLPYIEL